MIDYILGCYEKTPSNSELIFVTDSFSQGMFLCKFTIFSTVGLCRCAIN